MRTDEFIDLWRDEDLRQYIVRTAKGRNKLPQIQEEFIQEAWLSISCAPAGYNLDTYRDIAERAIVSSYWQIRRDYMITRALDQHFNSALSQVKPYIED